MKINNEALGAGLPVSTESASKAARDKAVAAKDPISNEPAGDTAETSSIARHLEADGVRLERLREAVRSGTYSVLPLEVSARLIDEHLEDSKA